MAKISELSDGGSLQSTDFLIAVRSGGNVKVQADGNLSLGTVTADGLTVEGNASIGTSGTSVLDFERSGANYIRANNSGTGRLHLGAGGDLRFHTGQADNDFTENERLRISSGGDISFYDTSGNAKFFWDASAESLGIGTSTPSTARLQVKGSGSTVSTNAIFAENSSGAGTFAIRDNGDAFILGNVGIGVSSPTGLLTLGTGTFSAAAANTSALYTSTTAGLVAVADGLLLVDRAGADVFKVDTDGNLLVGKTATNFATPGVQLFAEGFLHATASQAVANSGNVVSFSRNTTDGDIAIFAKDGSPVGSIGSALKSSVSRLMIGTGETNLYFFDTDNTIYPVDADGTDSDADTDLGASGARFKDLYLSGGVYFSADLDASNNTTTNGTNVVEGNIRVASTSYCFDANRANAVDGEVFRFRKQAVQVGNISVTGSATAYNTSSDYRLKENVVAMSGATERLKKLKPSRFNFIADPDKTVDGFLAHEVQDIVPEAITGTKDAVDAEGNPEYQGIDQSKLVPLLVATIQELEARIAALEGAN